MVGCRAGYFSWTITCFNVIFGCRIRPVVVVWYVLFHKFLEPLNLQGTSNNVLVLRIKAHKTIRVSHALWGLASSGKEGLRKWLLSY